MQIFNKELKSLYSKGWIIIEPLNVAFPNVISVKGDTMRLILSVEKSTSAGFGTDADRWIPLSAGFLKSEERFDFTLIAAPKGFLM